MRVLFSAPVLVIVTVPVARVLGELGETPLTAMIAEQVLPAWLSRAVEVTEVQLWVPTLLVWPRVPAATLLPAFSV